jgi:hypothetical protein
MSLKNITQVLEVIGNKFLKFTYERQNNQSSWYTISNHHLNISSKLSHIFFALIYFLTKKNQSRGQCCGAGATSH